jgi:hypothetical protein
MDIITAGALSSLLLEGIKWLIRKFILKNPLFDFSFQFYGIVLPLLNAIMPYLLFWLGLITSDPILSLDFTGVIKYLLKIFLGSAIAVFVNTTVNKPIKEYIRNK